MGPLSGLPVFILGWMVYTGAKCAKAKGYSALVWGFACASLVGLVAVHCLPSALSAEIEEAKRASMKTKMDAIGGLCALLSLILNILVLAWVVRSR